jgi:hypothetical protein
MVSSITPNLGRVLKDSLLDYLSIDMCMIAVSYLNFEDRISSEVLSKNCVVLDLMAMQDCAHYSPNTTFTLSFWIDYNVTRISMYFCNSLFRCLDYSNQMSLVCLLEELSHEGLCVCRAQALRKMIEADEQFFKESIRRCWHLSRLGSD